MKVGLDAITFDIPKIYVDIKDLAEKRGIDPDKLKYGLGLEKMSVPDVYQDAVVFGTNAVKKLIESEKIDAQDIDRIYVGTESSVDGSKPIASYILSNIENACFKPGALNHTDVVDLTFACIGGVDALQNSLDFVRANPDKKAIIVCCDIAKYDLKSTGEYTQGAGALAMLISANPSILSFDSNWAVSTQGVFDFFKPRRRVVVDEIENDLSELNIEESIFEIFKEQPVFDGQYSNQCYLDRTKQAYFRLKALLQIQNTLFNEWELICMHLPYCYQARRIFPTIFTEDQPNLNKEFEKSEDTQAFIKNVSKSEEYQNLVSEKIAPTEKASGKIGNMYTASIFMGLLSGLIVKASEKESLIGKKIGFLAYGSGSKSKAFQGILEEKWLEKIKDIDLFDKLDEAQPISISEYEELHQLRKQNPVNAPKNEFYLDKIETEKGVLEGARYYKFRD